ncbi:hypothetical protein SDC9_102381 [bioreactor metagenome]|jgi:hypothetical protein|uniref:Uncharacterized protein n=1 Tax=bioreactor metagenome TaxID=1076179 RepID=A0A645B1I0_9ZZZZ|nr:hypothetical protein [Sphaerochaeta sp.]
MLCLLAGCETHILTERTIEVVLSEKHPWHEASHHPLWYTLVYTNGKGGLEKRYLLPGTKRVKLSVARGKMTVIAAYPLSSLHPVAGFCHPGSENIISLSEENGSLADLLLNSYEKNHEAVENLQGTLLASLVGDASLVDGNALMVSLLNGELTQSKMTVLQMLQVTLTDLPEGYWVPERNAQQAFWSQWGESVDLQVRGGLQRWWNRERSLCLTLYADLSERRYLSSLAKAPLW